MGSRVKEIRNFMHEIPEKGGCEEKTSAYLAEELKKSGYETITGVGGHGVIGILRGKEKGPVVGVRGDMDALLHVIEGVETPVHSCGHDANCAMVLSAAEEIAKQGIKKGVLKIIFQPDEEGLKGAKQIVESGMVDDLEYLIGIHLRPIQEAQLGQATPSLIHGAANLMKVAIHGKVSHGARPHMGINAIDAAVLVVNAINTIKENPGESWSAKTTRFVSNGVVTNAIPDRVDMAFDIRAQTNKLMESLLVKIRNIVENAPKSIGATGVVEFSGDVPGADYDEEVVKILEKSIVETMGKGALLAPIVTSGGDDFHFYKKLHPALKTGFVGIGADLTPGLHDPSMKFNDEALQYGADVIANAIKRLLD